MGNRPRKKRPSQTETSRILEDSKLMKALARAEADVKAGHLLTHREVFKIKEDVVVKKNLKKDS